MLLNLSRNSNRSASSSRITDYDSPSMRLSPEFSPFRTPKKMPAAQSRGSLCSNNSVKGARAKIQRKFSTTCIPELIVPKEQSRRVTVLGAGNTGKSAIITQFLYERFPNRYKKTVDEIYRAEYEISGQNLTLEILDTSGYYQFPAMRELAIRKSDAFILVFSVDNEDSLEELKLIREEILRIKDADGSHNGKCKIPMVVVANKIDTDDDKWKIDRTYVECLVKCDWGSCGYVQSSAKTNVGIVEIFKELLVQANVKYALSPAIKKRRESMPNVFANRNTSAENDEEVLSICVGSRNSSRRGSVVTTSGKRDSCIVS